MMTNVVIETNKLNPNKEIEMNEKFNLTLGEIRKEIKAGNVNKIGLNVHCTDLMKKGSTYVDEMMLFPISKRSFLAQYKDYPASTQIVSSLNHLGILTIG